MLTYRYLPAIAWALIILVLILMPGKNLPDMQQDFFISLDKLAHFGVFSILSFLTLRGACRKTGREQFKTSYVLSPLLISVAYGLLLEIMQIMAENRMPEYMDALANTLGCFAGLLFFIAIKKA